MIPAAGPPRPVLTPDLGPRRALRHNRNARAGCRTRHVGRKRTGQQDRAADTPAMTSSRTRCNWSRLPGDNPLYHRVPAAPWPGSPAARARRLALRWLSRRRPRMPRAGLCLPAVPARSAADAFARFRVLHTTVHRRPPAFLSRADSRPVTAGERWRTGVNEPKTEPRPDSAAWSFDQLPGGAR